MKMYEYVIVPPSVYRKEPSPGIYIGKRPGSHSNEEMVLMRDKINPTTFVLRVLRKNEFEKVIDTGLNAEAQIKDIDTWFEKIMRLYEKGTWFEKAMGMYEKIKKEDPKWTL